MNDGDDPQPRPREEQEAEDEQRREALLAKVREANRQSAERPR
ncbi:hypothetical protein SSPIM334S_02751 [Streptomyces spiroverticillatus]